MENRKWLLMKAIEHNWDEMGPGDWKSTEWLIFSDKITFDDWIQKAREEAEESYRYGKS